MTKSQIKAELRRSASEDEDPWVSCQNKALDAAYRFHDELFDAKPEQVKIFFLLVAEAL